MDEASIANKTKFDCDKCDYQATFKINLKEHIESKHQGIKYDCDKCDNQATLKRNLKEHTESKHQSWTTLEV